MRFCLEFGGRCPAAGRLVPILGRFRDAPGSVARTPAFRKFPLFGDTLMAVTMDTDQQFPVSVAPVDRKGKPAKVDGPPTWLTDNTDVLALAPSADGLSCVVTAVGVAGTAKVQVTADADLGAGVEPLVGTIDVEVTPAKAAAISLTPGAVADQP